jgi:hypothetical protein
MFICHAVTLSAATSCATHYSPPLTCFVIEASSIYRRNLSSSICSVTLEDSLVGNEAEACSSDFVLGFW